MIENYGDSYGKPSTTVKIVDCGELSLHFGLYPKKSIPDLKDYLAKELKLSKKHITDENLIIPTMNELIKAMGLKKNTLKKRKIKYPGTELSESDENEEYSDFDHRREAKKIINNYKKSSKKEKE